MKLTPKKQIDMAWGSPSFLSSYWACNKIQIDRIKKPIEYSFGSRQRLKKRIKQLHNKIKNVETKNCHIVVAAGASQILLALLNVLRETTPRFSAAHAPAPHFSRFPVFANYAKLNWLKEDNSIVIISSPNNPDNKIYDTTDATIIDACYNWPQYTNKIVKHNHPIVVFSLSKATGHASTRIGWAIVKDKQLAKKLEHHIEITTGGLSIDAQVKAEKILEHQIKASYTVFDHGQHVLSERWKAIESIKKNLSFDVLNKSGMFLWAKGYCPPHILHMKGNTFGVSPEYFRLNIGCKEKDFELFLKSVCKNVDVSSFYHIKKYY